MRVLRPKVETVGEVRALVGEAAYWCAREAALLWVDIHGRQVLRTRPDGTTTTWSMPEFAGFVQPRRGGKWLVGQQSGIVQLDPVRGEVSPFLELEADDPTTRCNDSACDPSGTLWVGTMRSKGYELEAVGALYRIGDGAELIDSGLYVPNGIAFSPDGDIAYWADTFQTRRQVWQAKRDAVTGALGAKTPFVQIAEDLGRPDGATVDADGCYWVAGVGGGRLLRYTPVGELDLVIELPVTRPSKLAFGGSDLRTIFVTSISDGGDLAAEPLAGRLLALDVGTAGLPASYVA